MGVGGSDRLVLIWPDYDPRSPNTSQAVANAWMELTMLATPRTGLEQPQTFSFGNLIGETTNPPADGGADLRVNASDLVAIRRALGTTTAATITNKFDVNKDARVTAADVALVRANQGKSISPTPSPPPAVVPQATPALPLRTPYRSSTRQLLADAPTAI
jgi:hypothetical protein